jgi:hypothetical protein
VNLFFVFFAAAELDARASFGFGARKAGAFKVVGAKLDVGAEFVVQIGSNFRTLEKGGDAYGEIRQKFHCALLAGMTC